ncbi:MAG: transglutaminase-like domain-containing protein [Ruminococcus sp.]|nr:transglutaminase-like domain-containing protein [Ruminococcus sp.]
MIASIKKNEIIEKNAFVIIKALLAFIFSFLSYSLAFSEINYYCYIAGIIVIALLYFVSVLRSNRIRNFVYFLFAAIIFITALAANTTLTSQLGRILNLISNFSFIRYSFLFPLFDVKESSVFAQLFLSSIFSLIIYFASASNKRIISILIGLMISLPVFIVSSNVNAIALSIFALLILNIRASKANAEIGYICISLVFVLVFFVFLNLDFTDKASSNLLASVKNLLYSADSFNQPNGDISNADSVKENDQAVLEIIMEEPQETYLHGFLGYYYDGGKWQEAEISDDTLSHDEFLLLKNYNFSSQNQTVCLASSLEDFSVSNVIINNIAADSRYLYLPVFSAVDSVNSYTYPLQLENKSSLFSLNTYSVKALSNSEESITELSNIGFTNNSSLSNYLSLAELSDEYYRENFTALSEDIYNILAVELEDYSCENGNVSEASSIIYDYLSAFTYDESMSDISLEDFLQVSKSGWSIHYASAAVEIFRYYGIPARYAEGYVVTSDDIEGKISNSQIDISNENFHAWAEYYLEGVGWIPFETVPKYIELMPSYQSNSYVDISGEASQANVQNTDISIYSGERISNKIIDEPDNEVQYNIIIVFAIILCFIIFVMVYFIIISRNKVYAFKACVRSLSRCYDLGNNSGAIYDFSAVKDENILFAMDDLQDYCLKKFYSRDFNLVNNSCSSLRIYLKVKLHVLKMKLLHHKRRKDL